MHINLPFIKKTLTDAMVHGTLTATPQFNVDSRHIQSGDIFVAIKGAHVDGHDFIDQAVTSGAQGVIVESAHFENIVQKYPNMLIIAVQETESALIELAHAWRNQFDYPVVGVTGSVGKTSTKEMLKIMLSFVGKQVLASAGNQNTLIGAAINMLKMTHEHDVAVFELGIAQSGSMKKLVELVKPTTATITYIGHAHMQGLGDLHDIANQKRDIFSLFSSCNVGVINGDQSILTQAIYQHPIITFGMHENNDVFASNIAVRNNQIQCTLTIFGKKYDVRFASCNIVRVHHAMAALAIAHILNIDMDLAVQGVQQEVVVQGRFAIKSVVGGGVIIDDSYNANPDSMQASLQAFQSYQTDLKKMIILGDMLELGEHALHLHRNLAVLLNEKFEDISLVLIGKYMQHAATLIKPSISVHHFEKASDAVQFLQNVVKQKNHAMLFKASQSVGLSKIIPMLMEC